MPSGRPSCGALLATMPRPPSELGGLTPLYINLDRRPDRREECEEQLRAFGFSAAERVVAVDGQLEVTDAEIDGYRIHPTHEYKDRRTIAGHVGCTKSWLKALARARELGQEWTPIFEDDVLFSEGAQEHWQRWAALVPGDCQIAMFGVKHRHAPEPVDNGEEVYRVRWAWNSTGILVHRDAIGKLIGALAPLERGIDWAWNDVHGEGRTYCSNPHFATQRPSHSDILHRRVRHDSRAELAPSEQPSKRDLDERMAELWRTCTERVTADEAFEAVELAAAEVRETVGRKRAVYGWSAGKDSIAMQPVMEAAGIERSLLGIIPKLEWREYLLWVREHAPESLTVIGNTDLDLPWLGRPENRHLVFPRNSKDGYFWTLAGTRRAQNVYQEKYAPEVQIYGRRKADGNVCGDERGISKAKSSGVVSYNPIRDWSHELTLAVIRHFGLSLPPVPYERPHGWSAGTGAWAGRRVGSIEESWDETYLIEPGVVRKAAHFFPEAYDCLERQESQ